MCLRVCVCVCVCVLCVEWACIQASVGNVAVCISPVFTVSSLAQCFNTVASAGSRAGTDEQRAHVRMLL